MTTTRTFRTLAGLGAVGAALLATTTPAHAVPPTPPSYTVDDAGDVAFVRNAIRALLARQPKGHTEIDILVDVAATLGRGAVVDLLMMQPEFERYWLLVLADDLKIDRDDTAPLANSGCYDEPDGGTLADTTLIDHVLNDVPANPWAGGSFNMTDMLRSTIEADRLMPLYKMAVMPMVVAIADDDDRRDKFMDVYLNREGGCLDCHTSIYSRTDSWSGFDRFAPPPFALEHSVFPQHAGACATDTWGPLTGDAANGEVIYDAECAWCHDPTKTGGAWGGPSPYAPPHAERIPSLNNDQLAAGIEMMIDDGYVSGLTLPDDRDDLMAFLRNGNVHPGYGNPACLDWRAGSNFMDRREACPPSIGGCAPSTPLPPWGLSNQCGLFGSAATAVAAGDEWLGATAESPWAIAESLGNASLGEVYDVRDCTGGAVDCVDETLPIAFAPPLTGSTAFGYMVGYNIVENIVHEVSGAELTIANRFARVDDGNAVVRHLTEEFFLPNGLSLKKLLHALLLSPVFNRNAPKHTTLATPYELPMVLNPWAYTDDPLAGPDANANGQGDFVHRYSIDNLLLAVHYALGWPRPRLLPTAGDYPTIDFVTALGQRIDDDTPGFSDLTFQALYEWENVVGLCEKPTGVGSDWIDALQTAVTTETVEDVLVAVKNRLLQERVNDAELDAVETFFGINRSDQASVALAVGPGEHMLRHYCGILLSTPQFMLSGAMRDLASPAPPPPAPLDAVCLPGEECTKTDLCTTYEGDLLTLGHAYTCPP